jgi:hypothetical protein
VPASPFLSLDLPLTRLSTRTLQALHADFTRMERRAIANRLNQARGALNAALANVERALLRRS